MFYKKMIFKGVNVFVETDRDGNIIVADGLARMKYQIDDERIYCPKLANLNDAQKDTLQVEQGKTNIGKTCKKSNISNTNTEKDGASHSIIAYTDGACSGNPGPAGLGYAICYPGGKNIIKGEPLGEGTNNIAELTAIFRVLDNIDSKEIPVLIHTDSSYSIGVLTQGWKAKANQQLILKIKNALKRFRKIEFVKVKGHAGIKENEMVDRLARKAAETQQIVEESDL